MEKTLSFITRAEECQLLALSAPSDEFKEEYLKLAAWWVELADERQLFLIEIGRTKLQ